MSLYRAEMRRLTKRRFTKFFVLIALVVLGLLAGGTAYTHEKTTAKTRAAAEAAADRDYQEQLQFAEQARQECRQNPSNFGGDCDNISGPAREDISSDQFLTPPFDFREDFGVLVVAWAAMLALVAFIIGASFVGAEWNSGGMMNLLLWRPQRLRVLSTKLVALLSWLFGLSVLSGAVWTGLFWLIATLRGTTERVTPGAWQSIGLTGLRGLALVLVAGAIGFGVASIGRHTAAALGAAIGVIVIFQFGLGIVLELARAKFYEAYLLPAWIGGWMLKSYEVVDYNAPCDYSATNGCEQPTFTITWQMAGGLFATVALIIVGAAMMTIRKRDIT
ncbi:ABC transporter permease subunit [Actinoplanes oblitus]|uniref:ABC transporter permease subunit n=1 Tax=Actinoplanes oblitus TaxID=3040509 RepID=A0ABY8WK89_9ACTN|nr:ABC transporter permease subunit [Actinoplanes oblitus]WIM96165.1 ABC transporter permease subunit [Actinoplanes oblitus]